MMNPLRLAVEQASERVKVRRGYCPKRKAVCSSFIKGNVDRQCGEEDNSEGLAERHAR